MAGIVPFMKNHVIKILQQEKMSDKDKTIDLSPYTHKLLCLLFMTMS